MHFIRQVKGDGTISVLNEDFDVGELPGFEYARATIDIKLEQLKGCYLEMKGEEASLIKIYEYKIGETTSYLIINYFLFFVVVSVFVSIVPGANDICDIPSDVDNNS